MSSFRRRLWSAIAVTIGVLLVLTGIAAPAQAITTRTITLGATPTAQVAGAKFLFAGHLSKSPTGSTVKLQRKVGTRWVSVVSTRTKNRTGYFAINVTASTVPGTKYFRATAGASARLSAAISRTVRVTALRKVTIAIKATPSTLQPGQQTTLSGTVKPFVSGDVGFIQRFNGATWIDLTTATISRTGTFSRTFTPQATTTYRLYVPRQGLNAAAYSASTLVQIPTGPVPPTITTTSMPDGVTETAYSTTLTKTGEAGTWAITAGALPPGLNLGAASGTVTGTPTAGGTFNFTVTFSQTDNLLSDNQDLSIKVLVKPRITTTSLPVATAFSNYSTPLTVTGQPGSWSVSAGSLPAGVTLNAGTGVLSGKPTVAGSYPVTFAYTETASGLVGTKALTLTVNPAPNPAITTASLPNATAYSDYSTTLAVTGNPGTWSITSGSLPSGTTFNTTTGLLSGKPTVSGDFPLTFKFTETESGTSDSKSLPLHVNPAPDPVITTTSLTNAQAFSNYSMPLSKTGNAGTWSITSGALPAGLTLDSATGLISGKPTVSGDFLLTFKFTETESGTFDTKSLTLHVIPAPNPTITTTSPLTSALINASYSAQLAKTGNAGTWSITSGTLPSGVALDPGTGLISGTPTVSGTFNFTVKFTETESGTFDTKAFTLVVYSRPTVTTAGLPDAVNGNSFSYTLAKTGGSGSGTWALSAGALPPGLSLSAAGAITGTPNVNGDYAFTVRFADSITGAAATRALSIHVGPIAITTPFLPDATQGAAYSVQFTGSPGTLLGGAWGETGALPAGMTFTNNGLLSGTPTVTGDFTINVSYSVLLVGTRTRTYTLHVG